MLFYVIFYQNSFSCLDYLRKGVRKDGIYTIALDTTLVKVWCDLTSEPGSAWTLILSYAFKNRNIAQFCSIPLSESAQRKQNIPNWEQYRLLKPRMEALSSQLTHVRMTSSYPIYGVDYRDYLRAKISSLNIFDLFTSSTRCATVEYVNIRGIVGKDLTVATYQFAGGILHVDSGNTICQYDGRIGAVASENNFGFHCYDGQVNKEFRSCENDESTIQYWFGGYL